MRLLIATINNASFSVALGDEKMARFKIVKKEYAQSEMLLRTIDALVKQRNSKTTKQRIANIFVAEGPGAFSALRIGIATANALAYALNVPVIGLRLKPEWKDWSAEEQLKKLWQLGGQKLKKGKAKQFTKAVEPFYGQAPHITKRR